MQELFVEEGVETTSQVGVNPDAAQVIREAIAGRQVCPFCGAVREEMEGACPRCSMENTSASRQATKVRIGPWYVFQTRNPAAPGMKFETLLTFVRKGRVKARSVVRGPTTHQLWRFAAHVKGLSREFGICYSCGGPIERIAGLCPHCNRSQEPPDNPDLFLEGQEADVQVKSPPPKQLGPTPLPAEDVVAPAMGFEHPASSPDPLDASAPADKLAKKGPDGYLSPHDLAAAFNLDFRPKAKSGRQTQSQFSESQGQKGGFYGRDTKPRRGRKWGRYLLVLLVLAAGATAAYAFSTKPALRAQATDYLNQGLSWTKQKWSQLTASHAGPSHPTVAAPSEPRPLPPGGPHDEQPAFQPQTTQPDKKQDKPNTWDQLYNQQSPPSAKSSGEAPAPPRPTTVEEMRTLYWAAIDAEAQGDFATAVKKYQQIKQLPQDLWPKDLDLRLEQAKNKYTRESALGATRRHWYS